MFPTLELATGASIIMTIISKDSYPNYSYTYLIGKIAVQTFAVYLTYDSVYRLNRVRVLRRGSLPSTSPV